MSIQKSLLRYPGGKTRAVQKIVKYIPKDVTEILSPFLGGGSIELYLASNGIKVYGCDLFKELMCFWQLLLTDKNKLHDFAVNNSIISKEIFYKMQKDILNEQDNDIVGAMFYILNRCSFSGTGLSGGMTPGQTRYTHRQIANIASFKCDNLTVEQLSFEDSLNKYKDLFVYADPPYLLENSCLYGVKGDKHHNFDHETLRDMLIKRNNGWIVSYNDNEAIRDMYKGYKIVEPEWAYGMSSNKKSNEILVLNL